MTLADYKTDLTYKRGRVAARMRKRAVNGQPTLPGDTTLLLTIGLLLRQGAVFTRTERTEISYFLTSHV